MSNEKKTLLTFPCEFSIKVFGYDTAEFKRIVFNLVKEHAPDLTEDDISERPSEHHKYIALNITISATSQMQLDNIYRALSSSKDVLMAL